MKEGKSVIVGTLVRVGGSNRDSARKVKIIRADCEILNSRWLHLNAPPPPDPHEGIRMH
jgi:hypothetical protein